MTQPKAKGPRGVRTGPAESMLVTPDDPALTAYREAQIIEYSTYVAAYQITTDDGVPIYNYGDPVPVSNVERHGYDKDGSVLKLNPKTGEYEEIKSAKSTSDGGGSK